MVPLGEGLTPRHSLLPMDWDGCSLIIPLEVRAELLQLWGQGDPENTSLTDLISVIPL